MDMDGDIPQLLTAPTIADMATSSSSSYPSSSSLINCTQLPLNENSDAAADDIDWVGLLSAGSLSLEMEKPCGSEVAMADDVGGREGYGGKNKGKMVGKRSALPRIAFQTRSAEDVLDDGYRWRKYGQKAVKHSSYPRSYYRCTHHTCNVKKQIQRHSKDPNIVVTTYEGVHNHPSEKLMETLSPLLKQLQFLSGI
uniref:WRKY transcription factor 3 n=1 Tax=Siraitia grosvenorii TaxID=190515 RepID=A0A3Q9QZY9_SIRGR|nr:WRKY transcription factor 3 [Siraitia grosvenorii]QEE82237.1 WRKY transcription factor 3 [Siraitia grosvenorii]